MKEMSMLTGTLSYKRPLDHSCSSIRLTERNLADDRVLFHHRPALDAEPVSSGGIVFDNRPATIIARRLGEIDEPAFEVALVNEMNTYHYVPLSFAWNYLASKVAGPQKSEIGRGYRKYTTTHFAYSGYYYPLFHRFTPLRLGR